MTKPILSVASLLLLERGKFKLDDPVETWLPGLANRKVLRKPDGPIDDTVPSPRSITLADLLSFRCGYGSNGTRGPFGQTQQTAAKARDTGKENVFAQNANTGKIGEFIFDTAPFASCHASSIVELSALLFYATWRPSRAHYTQHNSTYFQRVFDCRLCKI